MSEAVPVAPLSVPVIPVGVLPTKKVLPRRIPLSQQAVATAFVTPGTKAFLNQTQSYKAVHAHVTVGSARVEGHRVLTKPDVRQWVTEQLSAGGLTKEKIVQALSDNANRCWNEGKLSDHREASLAVAKLCGYLIDKQEVRNMSDQEKDTIRRTVAEALTVGHPN